ncbi:hypothetical protein ACEQ103284_11185 [Actinobacillus equuli subsp. equuli]
MILFAVTCKVPFASFTCNNALRSSVVCLRLKPSKSISVSRVVEECVKFPATSRNNALFASITPPLFSASPETLPCNIPPEILPLFTNLSAANFTKLRPAIVPSLINEVGFTFTLSAEINVPLPLISPLRATAYTFGTKTCTTWLFGNVTLSVSNQTISEVS